MRRRRPTGTAYYLQDGLLQTTAALTEQYGHNEATCAWCAAYRAQQETSPCPHRQQLNLFDAPTLACAAPPATRKRTRQPTQTSARSA